MIVKEMVGGRERARRGTAIGWRSAAARAVFCMSSPRLHSVKVNVKERIVLREIHFRTTGRHLSMGSHSVICHPTEVTAPPSPQLGRLVFDIV